MADHQLLQISKTLHSVEDSNRAEPNTASGNQGIQSEGYGQTSSADLYSSPISSIPSNQQNWNNPTFNVSGYQAVGVQNNNNITSSPNNLPVRELPQAHDQSTDELSIHPNQDRGSTLCEVSSTISVEFCTEADIQTINNRHDNIYPMIHKRGLVVILNNNFEGEFLRKGTEYDVFNMENMWTDFGCKVITKINKTGPEMKKILQDIAKGDEGITGGEKFNYLVVFVMSHGGLKDDTGEEIIYGNDAKSYVLVKNIKYQFSNANSEYWFKIPKLFFFQFCRGTNIDAGYVMPDYITRNSSTEAPHCSYSDVHISYATLSEFNALRNTRYGSWFISAIKNVFMKYARIEHVAELMTRVREAVSSESGEIENDDGTKTYCKAIGESHDMLSRILYLQPGRPSDDLTMNRTFFSNPVNPLLSVVLTMAVLFSMKLFITRWSR